MTEFNFDMSVAPKGKLVTVIRTVNGKQRSYQEHHVAPLWIATHDGKVHRSYWIPATNTSAGRWSGFSPDSSEPMAWQHFVTPVHPSLSKPLSETMTAAADHLFAADGVGGQ